MMQNILDLVASANNLTDILVINFVPVPRFKAVSGIDTAGPAKSNIFYSLCNLGFIA